MLSLRAPAKQSHDNGFTLFEILIVITIFVLIATFGLFLSMDFYRSYSFRSEVNMAVSILEKTRSLSLNNVDQTEHGLEILGNGDYVVFEGHSYDPSSSKNQIIKGNSNVTHGGPTDVVFAQLTGSVSVPDCSTPCNLTLSSGVKNATIMLNKEGQISW